MSDSSHRPDLFSELLSLRTWTAFDVDAAGRVLAGHDEHGSLQLVELAPDGRRTQLTALPGRCQGRYVPGRRAVVVEHDQGGDELWQLSLLDLDRFDEGPGPGRARPAGLEDLVPLVADPAHRHALHDVTPTALVYATNRRNEVDMDVVARSWATGDETVLYDGGGYVGEVAASRDGERLAVVRLSLQPASTVVDVVVDGEVRPVTDADERAAHDRVSWTPDGAALVLSSNHDREFRAVLRLDVATGEWRELVADDAHDLWVWAAPDGSALVVGRVVDGATELSVHEPDGTRRCAVDLGRPGAAPGVSTVTWADDGSGFVTATTAPDEPAALHLFDPATGTATLLVSVADGLEPGLRAALTVPTVHRVPTPDGEQVPCFVYAAGENGAPELAGAAVLHVHGGPEAAALRIFNPVVQALAAAGLTVLVPNVRGSDGYGKRWVSLDDVELRLDSVADLAALRDWLPDLGLDPERAALWGGSYGGYMVLAGVSMQPGLWAAGVDIVGMSSLVTFLENTSDYRRAYREREYGTLAHHRDFLEAASPLTHLAAIQAPLFVIHGANDPRVPLSEAEQIKAALDGAGVPCELRVYGDEGHGLARRTNRLDAYPAALAFLERHLRGA